LELWAYGVYRARFEPPALLLEAPEFSEEQIADMQQHFDEMLSGNFSKPPRMRAFSPKGFGMNDLRRDVEALGSVTQTVPVKFDLGDMERALQKVMQPPALDTFRTPCAAVAAGEDIGIACLTLAMNHCSEAEGREGYVLAKLHMRRDDWARMMVRMQSLYKPGTAAFECLVEARKCGTDPDLGSLWCGYSAGQIPVQHYEFLPETITVDGEKRRVLAMAEYRYQRVPIGAYQYETQIFPDTRFRILTD
jgi:hypothetical protein